MVFLISSLFTHYIKSSTHRLMTLLRAKMNHKKQTTLTNFTIHRMLTLKILTKYVSFFLSDRQALQCEC